MIARLIQRLRLIFRRIADALSVESRDTQKMLAIYNRHLQGLSKPDEVRWANAKFRDVVKGIGFGTLIVLPLAPITLPLAVRIGRWLGVDILPSWYDRVTDADDHSPGSDA